MAASLARADLFTGILQKLNQKKGVVRVNLLRIVRSVCDSSEGEPAIIRDHPLFEVIQRLAESDTSVLVRNMASKLVKSNLDKDQQSSSGSGGRPRQAIRKSSYSPPSLQQSVSMPPTPMTPTYVNRVSQSSAFIDGSVTPRRGVAPSNGNDSILYRPRSRDGPALSRKTSGEISSSGAPVSKSRLPRTSMLRSSRSSMAVPTSTDESAPSSGREPSTRRENGVRLRETPRSATSTSTNTTTPGGTAPQLSSKRRTRQPSGDIKWS